ncbi:putative baseplate assembly protein [Actinoplanes sp. ATCC 53533]|uniref:putative baseplate assembly protein n=1 Tax=Actinoplanes sp. ATCC 53533 TaxID=1288362 RepID=UPI000F782225|nr:putative baseplate assembly protein [Actinoplanes sp. ATCC 53533]RSM64735.1 putative baseplate assembly protein [Actinoplanes sp. ATCC 53533]
MVTEPAWWGKEFTGDVPRLVPGPGPSGRQPELVNAVRAAIRDRVRGRVPAYTPDWSSPDPADAGGALIELFAVQAAPVLERLNRLPEKLLTEVLRIAGAGIAAPHPAAAVLQFTVTPPDGASVLIPAGFQAGAAPADGSGQQVVFETHRDLWATPATLATVLSGSAGRLDPVRPDRPFAPFGPRPQPGDVLWLGLAGPAAPYPMLTVEAVVAPGGTPEPVGAGGDTAPAPAEPLLNWAVLDGNRYRPVEVARDGTAGLRVSGTIDLRLPIGWAPGRPPSSRPLPELRWLRVILAHGVYPQAPALAAIRLNAVAATAVRTVRDEALLPVASGPADGRTRMRLTAAPVVPGSVLVVVDDDLAGDPPVAARWHEVASLAGQPPDARVFTVDHATGELTFGDGREGAKVPPGFRNVRALSYRVGGGRAGAVTAGAVNATVTSLPFVTGVTNPLPASGGADAEPVERTLRHGPARLRAGGRAVTVADYAYLAAGTPGVLVARAHAVAGVDPARPGAFVPGVVGVFVVPARQEGGMPPVPDSATLDAVARHLAGYAAPAGVRVVAAAPGYQRVRIEARLAVDPDRDRAEVFQAAGDALLAYLHPVSGGADRDGWQLGAPLPYVALVRRLLAVPGVRAVPLLRAVVAGRPSPPCADAPLRRYALPWADRPVLIPAPEPGGERR